MQMNKLAIIAETGLMIPEQSHNVVKPSFVRFCFCNNTLKGAVCNFLEDVLTEMKYNIHSVF